MRHFYAKLSICLMVLSGLWSTLSAQQLSNLEEESTLDIPISVLGDVAQKFTTGNSSYQSASVQIEVLAAIATTVAIYDDDSGEPGSVVSNLSGSVISAGLVTYEGNVTLSANTTYYIVVSSIIGVDLRAVNSGSITTLDGFSAPNETQSRAFSGGWNTITGRRLRFSLQANANPLPVELTAFNAFKKDTEVALQWETAAEINNEGFAIERSADGRSWESLDFVSGHGTTEQAIRYQWMDERPMRGHNYYRLKQMDFDGKFEYSPVVQVDFSESGDFEVFPNPATEVLQYQLGAEQEVQRLQVYGQDGRLFHESERIDGQLDLSNFPAGRYILRLITAKGSMQKTFIVR